ncbi:uncharacterized protein LOC135218271 isoform X3 [Macrobrachium nipponense]|uniref:uncharacterized protein LOC135218271 isoform X3 n=1 Tax=Macrobrachium nipponense TaxID=159736 RepID=UPI0030C8AC79
MDFEEQRRMYAMNIPGHPIASHHAGSQQTTAQQVAQQVAQQQVSQQAPHNRILMPEGPHAMVVGTRHGPMDATMATMTSQMAGSQQITMHHTVHHQQLVHHQQQVVQQQTTQQQQQMLTEVTVSIAESSQETGTGLAGVVEEVPVEVEGHERILGLERECDVDENIANIHSMQKSWCLICDKSLPVPESSSEMIDLYKATMTVSQRKLSAMLGRLIGLTLYKAHSTSLCRRCFELVDQVDGLEIELADTKMELVQQYEATISHRQPHAKREIEKPSLEVDVEWDESNESDILDNIEDDPDCTATGAKKRKRKKARRKGGRPRKIRVTTKGKLDTQNEEESEERPRKRGRGRPRKKDKEDDEFIPPEAPTKSCPSCKKVIHAKKYLNHLSTHRLFPCPFCESVYKRKVLKKSGHSVDGTSGVSTDSPRCTHFDIVEDKPSISFTLLKGGTNRGKDLLADSLGYTYIRDKTSSQGCRWRCTIRNKHLTCCGSVHQVGFDPGTFTVGPQKHRCEPKDHASVTKKQISVEVKRQALARPDTSATTIVNEVMQSNLNSNLPHVSLPSPSTLARTANKYRQKYRTQPPSQRTKGIKKPSKPGNKKGPKVSQNGIDFVVHASAPPPMPQRPKGIAPPPLQPQGQEHSHWTSIFQVPPHYKYSCTNANY